MADHLTKDKRSWNMSRIRSRHTKPELIIRSLLHRSGFRFRINSKNLPGSPDIVLPKYNTVIFIHGCFWHRHPNCPKASTPKTNKEYWQKKFERNVSRDAEKRKELKKLNWHVMVLWECEIMKDPLSVLETVIKQLESSTEKKYSIEMDRSQIIKIAEKKSSYYLNDGNRSNEK